MARSDETVLQAALRHGIVLPYSCKTGTCASCKCRIVRGQVHYPDNPPCALDFDDMASGSGLACQAHPASDLVIDARELTQLADIPVRRLPARVEHLDRLSPQVMRLRLKPAGGRRLQFLAGQYVDIILPGGKRRAFSIASAPAERDYLELHVKHVSGGGFTGHVFSGMQHKEILRLEGPLGTFFIRRSSQRPMLMVGGGTGLAPLKSMIEELLDAGDQRPIDLYWGVRAPVELYADELIQSWQDRHPALTYHPVLSEPDDQWSGRLGWVHEAVLADYPDLSGHDVYMSGPPAMVKAARTAFLSAGVPEDRLFYDSFDFAPDVPPAES